MSKSLLFFVAGFCLISVALGGDMSNASRSPLSRRKPEPQAVTPNQVCRSKRYEVACSDTPDILCSALRCQGARGVIDNVGEAPEDMWCGLRRVCRRGRCLFQREGSIIPEPTSPVQLATCTRSSH